MRPSRVLRAVNISIAVSLVGLVAAGWWFLRRPAPKVSGSAVAPVAANVTITRDAQYRPHIEAASIDDVLFAQGYLNAQERLWQMDMMRRVSAGEVSEVAGRAALELDKNARKFRMRRIAERYETQLPPDERRALAAFARGVNHFIDTHRGKLGWEFAVMGYQPRPWRILDSLLVALQIDRTLTNSWEADLQKTKLLSGAPANRPLIETLFPISAGPDPVAGSNAFALSGRHTESGKPLLAGDPHLEFSIPSPWFPIHLKAPRLNVAGVALSGFPGVVIGHNDEISWSITSLEFDTMDLYAERADLRTGLYQHKGQVMRAATEQDFIAVKGERPVEMRSWITVHGPLFTTEGGTPMALSWSAAREAPFSFPVIAINQARNWQDFRTALSRAAGPGLNWIFASRDGHIGHQVSGRLPLRAGFAGDRVLDGASGTQEWSGFIPFEDLPSVFDPPSGHVVSANQNPFTAMSTWSTHGGYSAPLRSKQIREMLASRPRWSPETLLTIQKDVYSALHAMFAAEALRIAEKRGGTLAADTSILKGWNGQMEIGQPAPVLADLFYRQVRRRIGEKAVGGPVQDLRWRGSTQAIIDLIRNKPGGWFNNWDDMLASALSDSIEEGRRRLGKSIEKWDWARENTAVASHPIAGRIRWIAPYFSVGPVGISGSPNSVKQVGSRIIPSMRMVADTSNWDRSLLILPTGQSGHVATFHYKDEWDDFAVGRARPFLFGRFESRSTLVLTPSR